MKKPGPKPKGRVSIRWCPELAYAVGLIVADGSLSKDKLHIDFTSKDHKLACTYRSCLNITDIKIGEKTSGSAVQQIYYRVQFGDVLFYQWLLERGLTPNKSKTISKLNLSSEYFFDFLRGIWDGDGTIYCTRDTRWKSSYVVSMGIASGSYPFLCWIREEINARMDTTGYIYKGNKANQLRYARKDSKKIFDAMFYKNGLPHLARKFTKARKIFKIAGL